MAYALLAHVLARNFTEDGIFENWAKENIVESLKLTNTGTYTNITKFLKITFGKISS